MCFSAAASFGTAGLAALAGGIASSRVTAREEIPLASVPLVFAVQQGVEGLLWLNLPAHPGAPATSLLTHVFLVFAKIVWPILTPLAAYLIEPRPERRRVMALGVAAGILAGAYFLWAHFAFPHAARIEGHHIVYSAIPTLSPLAGVLYLLATCIAPLWSSLPTVRLLGAIVTVGSFVTYVFYWEAFTSVWCFFAAAGSAVIVFHFEKARRARRVLAGGT